MPRSHQALLYERKAREKPVVSKTPTGEQERSTHMGRTTRTSSRITHHNRRTDAQIHKVSWHTV